MTTATKPKTTIKFTALSPLTTRLLRARTEFIQRQGALKVGRTVATFYGEVADVDTLLDFLIMQEIPGAGASSKDVRRLRELRRFLRAATSAVQTEESQADAAHVTITTPDDGTQRDRILDLIAEIYEGASEKDWAEVDDLAEIMRGGPSLLNRPTRTEFRAWISDVL